MISDKRIEIAERMRGPFDVCECVGHTYLSGTLFGMQLCAMDELALRNGMRYLANLIDPTCGFLEDPDNDEFSIRVVSGYACRNCGHEAIVERTGGGWAEPPNYCPNCGARWVSE